MRNEVTSMARLENRGWMLAGSATAIATLMPVAMFQTGALKTLPDPPLSCFDSEQITASKAAHPLGIPDSLLGLASFGVTFSLVVLARRNRTARRLLGGKLALDAAAAAFNASRQVVSFGKLCSWCSGTALAAGLTSYVGRKTIRETFDDALSFGRSARAAYGRTV